MAANDLDVQVRIRNSHPELIIGVAEDERRKAGDHRRFAAGGEAPGDADEIALGDPDIEEPLRELLAEPLGPGRVRDIGIDDDDLRIVAAEGFQGAAERVPGRLADLSLGL